MSFSYLSSSYIPVNICHSWWKCSFLQITVISPKKKRWSTMITKWEFGKLSLKNICRILKHHVYRVRSVSFLRGEQEDTVSLMVPLADQENTATISTEDFTLPTQLWAGAGGAAQMKMIVLNFEWLSQNWKIYINNGDCLPCRRTF